MLSINRDSWLGRDNIVAEHYLHISDGARIDTRMEIFKDRVTADDADITFSTKEELEQWIQILRLAWQIKLKQDKEGWSTRP